MYSMVELDVCGAFQNLVRGKRVAAEWGHAKLNGRSLTKEETSPASFEASGLF